MLLLMSVEKIERFDLGRTYKMPTVFDLHTKDTIRNGISVNALFDRNTVSQ